MDSSISSQCTSTAIPSQQHHLRLSSLLPSSTSSSIQKKNFIPTQSVINENTIKGNLSALRNLISKLVEKKVYLGVIASLQLCESTPFYGYFNLFFEDSLGFTLKNYNSSANCLNFYLEGDKQYHANDVTKFSSIVGRKTKNRWKALLRCDDCKILLHYDTSQNNTNLLRSFGNTKYKHFGTEKQFKKDPTFKEDFLAFMDANMDYSEYLDANCHSIIDGDFQLKCRSSQTPILCVRNRTAKTVKAKRRQKFCREDHQPKKHEKLLLNQVISQLPVNNALSSIFNDQLISGFLGDELSMERLNCDLNSSLSFSNFSPLGCNISQFGFPEQSMPLNSSPSIEQYGNFVDLMYYQKGNPDITPSTIETASLVDLEVFLMQDKAPKNLDQLGKRIRLLKKYHYKQLHNKYSLSDFELKNLNKLEDNLLNWLKNPNLNDLRNSFVSGTKGIVMCMGEGKKGYAGLAYSTIKMVRTIFKSDVKFELFYLGEDDLTNNTREKFNRFSNIKFVNLDNFINNNILQIKGFNMKPFALLFSSFEEALLMDSDAIFLQNPVSLFEANNYLRTGSLFFHDRTMYPTWMQDYQMNDIIRFIRGFLPDDFPDRVTQYMKIMNGQTWYEQESGVVVVDKSKHVYGLLTSCLMLRKDERSQTAQYIYGDKETFWLGFSAVNEEFSFNDYKTGTLGVFIENTTPCGNGVIGNGYCSRGCCNVNGTCTQEACVHECKGSCPRHHTFASHPLYGKKKCCSTKLLHLDERGKPLWINGGLTDEKSDEDSPLTIMTEWATEPNGWWNYNGTNVYCFEIESLPNKFTESELSILEQSGQIYLHANEKFKNQTRIQERMREKALKKKLGSDA
ncbi:hypothetical protein HDU92_001412 [Lobulomyces angularis]|nr:hypothetical protein HDU92_001412 [Lobulomyces angularis]